MDLATMEEKHEKDLYPTPEDFIRDAKLIESSDVVDGLRCACAKGLI